MPQGIEAGGRRHKEELEVRKSWVDGTTDARTLEAGVVNREMPGRGPVIRR